MIMKKNEHIEQEELQKMKKEIDMLQDIKENKCTLRYCIKEEEESGQDLRCLTWQWAYLTFKIRIIITSLSKKNYHDFMIRSCQAH